LVELPDFWHTVKDFIKIKKQIATDALALFVAIDVDEVNELMKRLMALFEELIPQMRNFANTLETNLLRQLLFYIGQVDSANMSIVENIDLQEVTAMAREYPSIQSKYVLSVYREIGNTQEMHIRLMEDIIILARILSGQKIPTIQPPTIEVLKEDK
jgi:hypothetical protein